VGRGIEQGEEFLAVPDEQLRHPPADYEDPAKKELYEAYLCAWAMGLEYGHLNRAPRPVLCSSSSKPG
jgi:hypothetical protein